MTPSTPHSHTRRHIRRDKDPSKDHDLLKTYKEKVSRYEDTLCVEHPAAQIYSYLIDRSMHAFIVMIWHGEHAKERARSTGCLPQTWWQPGTQWCLSTK